MGISFLLLALVGLIFVVGLVVAIVLLTRSKKKGSVRTVFCPNCEYDLTGLSEARCPECGTQYTLNELWQQQHPPTGKRQ